MRENPLKLNPRQCRDRTRKGGGFCRVNADAPESRIDSEMDLDPLALCDRLR